MILKFRCQGSHWPKILCGKLACLSQLFDAIIFPLVFKYRFNNHHQDELFLSIPKFILILLHANSFMLFQKLIKMETKTHGVIFVISDYSVYFIYLFMLYSLWDSMSLCFILVFFFIITLGDAFLQAGFLWFQAVGRSRRIQCTTVLQIHWEKVTSDQQTVPHSQIYI